MGMVILVAAVIAGIAAIANENIQDLKAGYMVGATPWKQQFMLAVGVVVSALVIGPVLNLLYQAYGMGGVYPHPGMDPAQTLGAPQASLMAAVAQGVITHKLQWGLVGLGGCVALVMVAIDRVLRHFGRRLPALAVGLGIYLPPQILSAVIIGAFINYFVRRKLSHKVHDEFDFHNHKAYQSGILLACGLVAGSSLMGVVLAVPFVIWGNTSVLALVSANFISYANILGAIVFILMCYWLYHTVIRKKH